MTEAHPAPTIAPAPDPVATLDRLRLVALLWFVSWFAFIFVRRPTAVTMLLELALAILFAALALAAVGAWRRAIVSEAGPEALAVARVAGWVGVGGGALAFVAVVGALVLGPGSPGLPMMSHILDVSLTAYSIGCLVLGIDLVYSVGLAALRAARIGRAVLCGAAILLGAVAMALHIIAVLRHNPDIAAPSFPLGALALICFLLGTAGLQRALREHGRANAGAP